MCPLSPFVIECCVELERSLGDVHGLITARMRSINAAHQARGLEITGRLSDLDEFLDEYVLLSAWKTLDLASALADLDARLNQILESLPFASN
jgi:hypothetical protein